MAPSIRRSSNIPWGTTLLRQRRIGMKSKIRCPSIPIDSYHDAEQREPATRQTRQRSILVASATEHCRCRAAAQTTSTKGRRRADANVGFDASISSGPPAAEGRQRPFAASGSSRWLGLVAESLTCLCVPPPNVKFRGTADSRPRTGAINVRYRRPPTFAGRIRTAAPSLKPTADAGIEAGRPFRSTPLAQPTQSPARPARSPGTAPGGRT